MGLVRKANVDGVAAGDGDKFDTATLIRQAVTAEIERQQQERLAAQKKRDSERRDEDD